MGRVSGGGREGGGAGVNIGLGTSVRFQLKFCISPLVLLWFLRHFSCLACMEDS